MLQKSSHFKSTLQQDMMEFVGFHAQVSRFTPQPPFTISYKSTSGGVQEYTPFGLIEFIPEMMLGPILFDVMYRSDFRAGWRSLMPKFRAAKQFCLGRCWQFHVYTENEIRTPFLNNMRFLKRYKDCIPEPEQKRKMLEMLWDLSSTPIDVFLACFYSDKTYQAKLIPYVWNLLYKGAIGCDIDSSLTMTSRIFPLEDI